MEMGRATLKEGVEPYGTGTKICIIGNCLHRSNFCFLLLLEVGRWPAWKEVNAMTINMWLTMLMMVLVVVMANTNDYPTLQIWLAGFVYLILVAMLTMRMLW